MFNKIFNFLVFVFLFIFGIITNTKYNNDFYLYYSFMSIMLIGILISFTMFFYPKLDFIDNNIIIKRFPFIKPIIISGSYEVIIKKSFFLDFIHIKNNHRNIFVPYEYLRKDDMNRLLKLSN